MPHRILLVDDEQSVRDIIGNLLMMLGYDHDTASDGKVALDILGHTTYSVLITDIHMPRMTGIELVGHARKLDPDLGIIVITGVSDLKIAVQVMKKGANEYLLKPVQFDALNVSIEKCLEYRRLQSELRTYQTELEHKVEQRTGQLMNALTALQGAHQEVKQAYLDLVTVLAKTAESNDNDTGSHIRRVSSYVSVIARRIGKAGDETERLAQYSTTHDIGKVTIHPDILQKPGKLTIAEFEKMKMHTVNGAEILKQAPSLTMAANIAMYHHERFDGGGYPYGLAGDNIPFEARVMSVADVFDALTMKRCYKDAWSVEKAFEFIKEERERQFDPHVVDAFIDSMDTIVSIRQEFPD